MNSWKLNSISNIPNANSNSINTIAVVFAYFDYIKYDNIHKQIYLINIHNNIAGNTSNKYTDLKT